MRLTPRPTGEPTDLPAPEGAGPDEGAGPAVVSVRGASVVLAGRPVLRDVSLDVAAGEVVAVLGANGSGKSTLVRALLGLAPLASGSIRLFGRPLGKFSDWARIGYVPQRPGAGSGVPATVGEVVASGRLARRGFLRPPSGADRAAVARALATVGLADRRRERVTTLSGGQQQRVLVARALVGDPDLLILDEPNAGVDAVSQEAFASTVGQLVERGRTLLVVLHEIGPLAGLISRAVVIDGGRIAHDGALPAGVRPDPGDGTGGEPAPNYDVHPHARAEPPSPWNPV